MPEAAYKRCSKCEETKPVDEFYWHAQNKRLRSDCIDCVIARTGKPTVLVSPVEPDSRWDSFFAGFFDADGSVGIHRCPAPSYFLLSASASNTTRPVLDAYRARYEGSVLGPTARGARHKPIYVWRADSIKAERFLKAVQPYLIVKRDRVDLALEFRGLFRGENAIPRGHAFDSQRNRDKRDRILRSREECFERMRILNRRGVPDGSRD